MKKPQVLPEWFNLEKYENVTLFSLMDWYENLHKRAMFFTWISRSKMTCSEDQAWRVANAKKEIKKIIDMITEDPLLRAPLDKKIFHDSNTVKSQSNWDVVCNYQLLSQSAPEVFFDYLNLESRDTDDAFLMTFENAELKSFFDAQFRDLGFGETALEVTLHASDEDIIQDFKTWLANIRKIQGKKSKKRIFSKLEISQWIDYKILPYLDLKIWSIYSGNIITQSHIGNVLFPDEIDVDTTERIRKTTKTKADWLMSHSIIDALGVQISKEFISRSTSDSVNVQQ